MRNPVKSFGAAALIGGLAAVALAGCAETPTGPTVAVWPAPGKPLQVFQMDDAQCRQYAQASIGSSAAANSTAAKQIALSTAIAATAGLLIGDSSQGAGIGAGMGLLVGSAAAANTGEMGTSSLQRRYNIAYEQCMYTKGNQVPGAPVPNYAPAPPPPPSAPSTQPPPPPPPGG